jgi:hypothetical protein
MPPAGFEPAIPASEWPKTHAVDRTAIGIGWALFIPQTASDSDCIGCSESLLPTTTLKLNCGKYVLVLPFHMMQLCKK